MTRACQFFATRLLTQNIQKIYPLNFARAHSILYWFYSSLVVNLSPSTKYETITLTNWKTITTHKSTEEVHWCWVFFFGGNLEYCINRCWWNFSISTTSSILNANNFKNIYIYILNFGQRHQAKCTSNV